MGLTFSVYNGKQTGRNSVDLIMLLLTSLEGRYRLGKVSYEYDIVKSTITATHLSCKLILILCHVAPHFCIRTLTLGCLQCALNASAYVYAVYARTCICVHVPVVV